MRKIFTAILILCLFFTASCKGGGKATQAPTTLPAATMNILRLDGTVLDFTTKPISRSAKIRVTFDRALTDEEKTAIENAFIFKQGDNELEKTFQWADDKKSVVVIPAKWLKYATTYTIGIAETAVSGAASTDFKTALRRDVNGDGYVDAIVGAPFVDVGDADRGQAYVIYGTASGISDCTVGSCAGATITGAAKDDMLGRNVAFAGDVNGDGYADVIVGAPLADGDSGVNRGRAYIFYGSSGGIISCDLSTCTADATFTGEKDNDGMGSLAQGISVSTAGDVNGDGYDDVIIGEGFADTSGPDRGRAYILLGGSGGVNTTPATTIGGAADSDFLGYSVATAGDVNGDGFDDVIIGAHGVNGEGDNEGQAYVFLGGAGGISSCDIGACTPAATITGERNNLSLGVSVSTAGDIDADGLDDIIVGGNYGGDKGKAYIFLGSALSGNLFPSVAAKAAIGGDGVNDWLGASVSTAGDVNGDGKADVIVGAPDFTGALLGKGHAYVFLGGISLSGIVSAGSASAIVTGGGANDGVGNKVMAAGDVNGDGFDDVIVTAPGADGGKGKAYLLKGSATGVSNCDFSGAAPCTPMATITGASAGGQLGCNIGSGTNIAGTYLSLMFAATSIAVLFAARRRMR